MGLGSIHGWYFLLFQPLCHIAGAVFPSRIQFEVRCQSLHCNSTIFSPSQPVMYWSNLRNGEKNGVLDNCTRSGITIWWYSLLWSWEGLKSRCSRNNSMVYKDMWNTKPDWGARRYIIIKPKGHKTKPRLDSELLPAQFEVWWAFQTKQHYKADLVFSTLISWMPCTQLVCIWKYKYR